MLRSALRSALVGLASLGAAAPIEVITATFILVTLTYFQLLHAIKGSEFFTVPASLPPAKPVQLVRLSHPPRPDEVPFLLPSPPSPLLSSFNSNAWQPLHFADFRRVVEANAIEGGYVFPPELGGNDAGNPASIVLLKQLTIVHDAPAHGPAAADNAWTKWITEEASVDVGGKRYTYQDLCAVCDVEPEPHPLHASQSTLTLYFKAPSPDTPSLNFVTYLSHLPAFTPQGSDATFRVIEPTRTWGLLPSFDGAGLFSPPGESEESLTGLRSVRWLAYAVRALGMRFYALAKNADSADIFVVLLGYILMHVTFVKLFMNTRTIGSSFWLPVATLVSSTFAFLVALLSAYLLNVPIDPVCLSEALPFLVITVGFDKPFRLARAVFENPDLAPVATSPEMSPVDVAPVKGENNLGLDFGALHRGLAPLERLQRLADGKGVRWVVPVAARQIVVDAVRKAGSSIVRDYAIEVAVLSVGAASDIGGFREFCYLAALIMAADCLFLFSFYVAILSVMVEVHRIKLIRGNKRAKSLHRSNSSQSLQDDGSAAPKDGVKGGAKVDRAGQPENPVVRLKLFLIVSFLTLHILNLCTTLTDQTALRRHSTHSLPSPRVDTRASDLSPLLESLYKGLPLGTDMVVQVVPPTHLVVTDDPRVPPSSRIESIDNFMSEWTTLVGDPVLSKWIVIALGISILLNGYLLRGIASNSIGGKGPVAAAAAALIARRRRDAAAAPDAPAACRGRQHAAHVAAKGQRPRCRPAGTRRADHRRANPRPRGERQPGRRGRLVWPALARRVRRRVCRRRRRGQPVGRGGHPARRARQDCAVRAREDAQGPGTGRARAPRRRLARVAHADARGVGAADGRLRLQGDHWRVLRKRDWLHADPRRRRRPAQHRRPAAAHSHGDDRGHARRVDVARLQGAQRRRRRQHRAHAGRHDARAGDRLPVDPHGRRRQGVDRLGRGLLDAARRLQLDVALCAAAKAQDGARGPHALRALCDEHGRRHGHEHDLQGDGEGARGAAAPVPRDGRARALGQLLHRQEAGGHQLDRGPRQERRRRGRRPRPRRQDGPQDDGQGAVQPQPEEEPRRVRHGRQHWRLQRARRKHPHGSLPRDGPGPGAERRVVAVHDADGARQRRRGPVDHVLDAVDRGRHGRRRHDPRAAAGHARRARRRRRARDQPRRQRPAPRPRHRRRRHGRRAQPALGPRRRPPHPGPHEAQPQHAGHAGRRHAVRRHDPAPRGASRPGQAAQPKSQHGAEAIASPGVGGEGRGARAPLFSLQHIYLPTHQHA